MNEEFLIFVVYKVCFYPHFVIFYLTFDLYYFLQ